MMYWRLPGTCGWEHQHVDRQRRVDILFSDFFIRQLFPLDAKGCIMITSNGFLFEQILVVLQFDSYRDPLFITIDSKLNFEANCEAVCRKGHQRFVLLKEALPFPRWPNCDDLILLCVCWIDFVFLSCVMVWKPISKEQKLSESDVSSGPVGWLVSRSLTQHSYIPDSQSGSQTQFQMMTCCAPLHIEFQLLPSGRRFIVLRCRTKQYKNSFVPSAITQMIKWHGTDAAEELSIDLFVQKNTIYYVFWVLISGHFYFTPILF